MVYYSYAPLLAAKCELLPHLADYQGTASPKNVESRLAALSLLQKLCAHAGLTVDLPILKTEHGRPYFDAEGAPDFNLSHSGALAACALGARVGIDLQAELDTIDTQKLAARYFSEREQTLLKDAPRKLFFELWTKKEALGKYLGCGLTPLLGKDLDHLAAQNGVAFVTKRTTFEGIAYTLTLCTAKQETIIKI
ncbi:MAG: 4'-phosphopantetheinyl transferase superfamily protein [Clostridia bacterium]|nr:4'-phosphopantetheinyl transferase superfamily protein [Clostridia bacterium]